MARKRYTAEQIIRSDNGSEFVAIAVREWFSRLEVGGEIPKLDQRISVAKTLAGKVVPDLKSAELEVDDRRQKSVKEFTDKELMAMVRAAN